MNITVGCLQTNRNTDTGKTLKRWPVFVDHYNTTDGNDKVKSVGVRAPEYLRRICWKDYVNRLRNSVKKPRRMESEVPAGVFNKVQKCLARDSTDTYIPFIVPKKEDFMYQHSVTRR